MKPHTLFFITPGQVHFWDLTVPLEGIFVMFEPEFFHLHHPNPNFMSQFDYFHRTDTSPLLKVSEAQVQVYDEIIHDMHQEFMNPRLGQKTILASLLQILLVNAQRDYVTVPDVDTRENIPLISNQFQKLLGEHYTTRQNVNEYAELLHVSTSYLNRTIRQHTGLTAGELIRQRIILAAKRLLVHTNRTVAEIAYELNFNDRYNLSIQI